MAFTVEDGTGVANANSLCSVAVADAYFTERGNAAWTGADSLKQIALIKATDYIEARWGRRLYGTVIDVMQALCFPRTGIANVDEDEVPLLVQRACAEYALRALTKPLQPDPVPDTGGRVVAEKVVRVGPLETKTRYEERTPLLLSQDYPVPDSLMRGFTRPAGGGVIRC
jgi:hypothetical protein